MTVWVPLKPSPFLKPAVDAAHQFVADLTALAGSTVHVVSWDANPLWAHTGPFAIDVQVTMCCLTHGYLCQHHEVITADSDGHSRAEQVLAAFAQICQQMHSSMVYATGGYIDGRTPASVLADVIPALNQQYPFEYLTGNAGKCGPICWPRQAPLTLGNMIQHLNDNHGWSRERIADWLETLDLDLTLQAVSEGD